MLVRGVYRVHTGRRNADDAIAHAPEPGAEIARDNPFIFNDQHLHRMKRRC